MPEPIVTPPVPPKAPDVAPVVTPPVVEPTVYESAATAVEAWQKSNTPELKTAMDEAIKKAKEFKPEPVKPATPEKYEFKVKEGSQLDPKHAEAITTFAKANGLSQTAAQALLERDQSIFKAQNEKVLADYKATVDGWLNQSKADKEVGGDAFPQNVELAKRVVDKFFPEFKKVLEETGYGNHPDVLRGFYRLGKSMKEDELVVVPSPTLDKKSTAEVLFGSK